MVSTNNTALPFPAEKLLAFEVAARIASVFSVLGSIFIISTFVYFPFFRKAINRLVFFATFGNLLANVATLMSTSPIRQDLSHQSGLCEFQGVLIQWFMMADSLWVLCMAINVFLVFFHGYDSRRLRDLEKWYMLFSYGIPATPALIYVILDHTGHRILGPAIIWCWVAGDADWMRITFFYAPIWIIVSTTLTIYIITGLRIFRKRALFRAFTRQPKDPSTMNHSGAVEKSPTTPFIAGNNIVVTTQIKYDIQHDSISRCVSPEEDQVSEGSFSSTRNLPHTSKAEGPTSAQSFAAPVICAHQEPRKLAEAQRSTNGRNRYRATAFAANITTESATSRTRSSPTGPPTRTRTGVGNAAAMAYLKVAFLMFLALFVVWVPSSANRVYQFVNQDHPNFALEVSSTVVLPLQGAWNAVIYIFTTRSECKRAYGLIVSKVTGAAPRYQPRSGTYREDTITTSRATRESDAEFALDEVYEQGKRARPSEVSRADSVAGANLSQP